MFGGGVYDGYFSINPNDNFNGIWRAYVIPLFSHRPQKVLMIGLSSGSWAQVLANNPDIKHLTIIEINPGYLKLISQYNEVASLLINPKVNIIIDDGRRWLTRTEEPLSKDSGFGFQLKLTKGVKGIINLNHLENGGFNHLEDYKNEKYDLIVMNTTFYWRSYSPFLLSKDFFRLIQQHLTDTGVFYFNTTSSLDAVKTANNVFLHVNKLYNFVIASDKPLKFDTENLKKHLLNYRIDNKRVFNLNNVVDNNTIERIIAIQKQNIVNQETLEKTTQKTKVVTDDDFLVL